MADLFSSGHAVDLILLVIAAEFAVLVWRRRSASRGAVAVTLFLALAPGACLLLALRAALTGAPWPLIALWMAASFPIHIADLIRRRI